MSTLTLTAENPEILLKAQEWLAQFPEIQQKESADIKKAKAKAEFVKGLKQAMSEVKAIQRGELIPKTREELFAYLQSSEENED